MGQTYADKAMRIRKYEDLAVLEQRGYVVVGTVHFKDQHKQPCVECGNEFNRLNILSYLHSAGLCDVCWDLYRLNYLTPVTTPVGSAVTGESYPSPTPVLPGTIDLSKL